MDEDFNMNSLTYYNDLIYRLIMELCYLEKKGNINSSYFKKRVEELKRSLKQENVVYERIINDDFSKYLSLLHSEITLSEILKYIIKNDKLKIKEKRISNNFFTICNDKDSKINESLLIDSIETILYLLKNHDKRNLIKDYIINVKYYLAYCYPKYLENLLKNDFASNKELYWYSYLLKDLYNLSDDEFYSKRLDFIMSEMVNEYYMQIDSNNVSNINEIAITSDVLGRLMNLILQDVYEGVTPEEYKDRINLFNDKISLEMSQKIINTFNEDLPRVKIIRLAR